jgi:hypothetical protein
MILFASDMPMSFLQVGIYNLRFHPTVYLLLILIILFNLKGYSYFVTFFVDLMIAFRLN